eukprot:TRINITY_DN66449_c0_g1_i1.p1 TRINITY_DN66449_c0_g1~~TRINITY_DN66449_c0_g1_i1.p1  ORF type:complete len:362 (+),score=98.96 TRINITY_DN66449_c0_g1_i1:79-1164(+)
MGDDAELELGDDEPEPQAIVVDLPPPNIGEKIKVYLEVHELTDISDDRGSALQALERANPFQALRVMNMNFINVDDPHSRLRLLRSRLRNQSQASYNRELHERVTEFCKKWKLDERAEYALRALDDTAIREVIDEHRHRSMEGLDGHTCSKITMVRIKYARQRQREWNIAKERGQVDGEREEWRGGDPRGGSPPRSRRRMDSPERRVDPSDGKAYTKMQFEECYGGFGEWDSAKVVPKKPRERSPERRIDPSDGKPYTRAEFEECYGGTREWNSAKRHQPAPATVPKEKPVRQKPDTEGPFTAGAQVLVQGLTGAANLNGLCGTVKGRQGGRVIVDIPAQGEKALRAENLVAADTVYSAVD